MATVLDLQFEQQSFQYSELVSFRIDWFDLLAVQGTLESLLQQHNSKALQVISGKFPACENSPADPYLNSFLMYQVNREVS